LLLAVVVKCGKNSHVANGAASRVETHPKESLPGSFRPLFLIGEYDATIDDKNRLLIPSEFRKEIIDARSEKSLICRIGRKRVTWLYPENHYRDLIARKRTTLIPGEDEEAFNEAYFGMIFRLAPDAQGRVVLPEKVLTRARLAKVVTIVGAGDHLVIRNREDWEKRSEMLLETQDDITDRAKETIEAGPVV
jgi:MraZ protein